MRDHEDGHEGGEEAPELVGAEARRTEISYGIAGVHGTPYGGFHLGERGLRAFSSGVRYDLGSGLGLRLEATRRESALRSPSHTVGIRGRMRLR